ncbi:N-acetylneuraminate lyase-like [Saccostrea cucullata]|uniref:N-acetylneuraminate lyase-like n=1 Tax=Saccostrea cuccullata TaxID=36930 RepID=UPI002ED189E2
MFYLYVYTIFEKPFENFWLEGIVPAVFTPFQDDGELNLPKIDEYCAFLVKNDINAIFVNGTTGEGKSLTKEERKKVVEKWITSATGRLKVVVNVGGLNVRDSIDLAKHAVNAGADAIASLPPLFFKPNSIEILVEHCKAVADAVPNLPFYYYHLPNMTGVELKMEDFLIMAKKKIPNLVGLKFASKDLGDMIGCLFAGKFNILCGCDEQLMANMVMGAHGAVGTLYNFMPQLFHRLVQYVRNGEMQNARAEQIRAQKVLRIMVKYGHQLGGNVAAVKPFMTLVGLDLGPPRQPMRAMSVDETAEFLNDVDKLGFKDWNPALSL